MMTAYIPRELLGNKTGIVLWLQLYFPDYAPCSNCDYAKKYCQCKHIVRGDN